MAFKKFARCQTTTRGHRFSLWGLLSETSRLGVGCGFLILKRQRNEVENAVMKIIGTVNLTFNVDYDYWGDHAAEFLAPFNDIGPCVEWYPDSTKFSFEESVDLSL